MKKYIAINILVLITMWIVLMTALKVIDNIENYYTMPGVIEKESGGVVIVNDGDYTWEFEGDGYITGQQVKIKFFNNYTNDNRLDDKVVDVLQIKG